MTFVDMFAFGAGVIAGICLLLSIAYLVFLHWALTDARSEAEEARKEADDLRAKLATTADEREQLRALYLRASGAAWRARQ